MAPEEKLCDQKFDLNAARRLGRKVVPGPSNRITLRCSQRSASPIFVDWYSTCLACILQSLRRHNKVLRHNGARLHRVMGAAVVVEQRVHSWTHHTFGTACRFQAGSTVAVDGVFAEPWSKTQTTNRARLRQDGVAAKSAEGTKRRRYGVEAILFALETGGRWFELAQGWWSRFRAS